MEFAPHSKISVDALAKSMRVLVDSSGRVSKLTPLLLCGLRLCISGELCGDGGGFRPNGRKGLSSAEKTDWTPPVAPPDGKAQIAIDQCTSAFIGV